MVPKVKDLTAFEAVSPMSKPIADATHEIEGIRFAVVRVQLDNGVVGEGYLLAFEFNPSGLKGVLEDVKPLVLDRQVNATRAFDEACDREFEYFGSKGLLKWARGVVNIALWDAWARHLGVSVWRLLGTCVERVPVYGSGGWLSYSLEELLEETTGYVKRGFTSVKVKVGSPEKEMDIERVAKVREALGDSIRIMIDANQGLDYPAALELATALKPFGIHWFEEPLHHQDFQGYAALRQNAGLAIAMGEREFDLVTLRELTARSALDLWQPDILRLGGVEGWLDSAALARAYHLPVLPHYYKEYDVPLACTIPNAYGVESFDWVDGIVDRPLRIEKGLAYPSPGPGWGFRFKEEALKEL